MDEQKRKRECKDGNGVVNGDQLYDNRAFMLHDEVHDSNRRGVVGEQGQQNGGECIGRDDHDELPSYEVAVEKLGLV